MHTTASDGSDSPFMAAEKAAACGMDIFAVTDHDTMEGARQLLPGTGFARGRAVRIHAGGRQLSFLPGVEFSSRTDAGLCHILGYCCDPDERQLSAAVRDLVSKRSAKMEIRIENLKKNDGIVLTREEKDWIYSHESPGRPHIALILMKRGLADSVTDAFKRYLNSRHSPVPAGISRIEARQSLEAIQSAGGISSWAHPLGGEGERHISPEEFNAQLKVLMSYGLQSLECYYSRYSEEEIHFLLEEAERHGLLVSGGSDYHGKNKTIVMGQLDSFGQAVDPARLTILQELL